MFKWIWRILGIIILLGVLLVLGTCAWQNCLKSDTGPVPPSVELAGWKVTIKSTRVVLFTNDIKTTGSEIGKRVHILNGYWEVTKKKFIYHRVKLPLDESIFGPIEVDKR